MHAALLALLTVGCSGEQQTTDKAQDTQPVDTGVDHDAPLFQHTPVGSPQSLSEDISVDARIWDEDSSILVVQLMYRRQTSADWSTAGMVLTSSEEIYEGKIPANDLGSAGMHYYLVAVDTQNNQGVYPEGAPSEYLKFDLTE